jgi:hypothetical protein
MQQVRRQNVHWRKLVRSGVSVYARSIPLGNFDCLSGGKKVRKIFLSVGILLLVVGLAAAQQASMSDEGGRVLALENAWNHALEA